MSTQCCSVLCFFSKSRHPNCVCSLSVFQLIFLLFVDNSETLLSSQLLPGGLTFQCNTLRDTRRSTMCIKFLNILLHKIECRLGHNVDLFHFTFSRAFRKLSFSALSVHFTFHS